MRAEPVVAAVCPSIHPSARLLATRSPCLTPCRGGALPQHLPGSFPSPLAPGTETSCAGPSPRALLPLSPPGASQHAPNARCCPQAGAAAAPFLGSGDQKCGPPRRATLVVASRGRPTCSPAVESYTKAVFSPSPDPARALPKSAPGVRAAGEVPVPGPAAAPRVGARVGARGWCCCASPRCPRAVGTRLLPQGRHRAAAPIGGGAGEAVPERACSLTWTG